MPVTSTFTSAERHDQCYIDLLERVLASGWLHFSASDNLDIATKVDLVARSLGKPVVGRKGTVMDQLVPTAAENAEPKSLSAIHGQSSFPLHTDGAHLIEPPRFIVLACVDLGSSLAPTVLVRFQDLEIEGAERERLQAATYLVRNGRKSFYSSVYSPKRPFIRLIKAAWRRLMLMHATRWKQSSIAVHANSWPSTGESAIY